MALPALGIALAIPAVAAGAFLAGTTVPPDSAPVAEAAGGPGCAANCAHAPGMAQQAGDAVNSGITKAQEGVCHAQEGAKEGLASAKAGVAGLHTPAVPSSPTLGEMAETVGNAFTPKHPAPK